MMMVVSTPHLLPQKATTATAVGLRTRPTSNPSSSHRWGTSTIQMKRNFYVNWVNWTTPTDRFAKLLKTAHRRPSSPSLRQDPQARQNFFVRILCIIRLLRMLLNMEAMEITLISTKRFPNYLTVVRTHLPSKNLVVVEWWCLWNRLEYDHSLTILPSPLSPEYFMLSLSSEAHTYTYALCQYAYNTMLPPTTIPQALS